MTAGAYPLIFLASALAWAEAPAHRFERSAIHMGTRFRVVFYASDEAHATKAATDAFARIEELNSVFSDYLDSSELNLVCQQAGGPPVKISDDLFRILVESNDLAELSDGAFDVTISPLSRQWRRARRLKQLPTQEQLDQARSLVGYKSLEIDLSEKTVRLARKGMKLDLGGIAKGYACDAAIKVFKKHGISRALVDGGGGVSVSSPPPDKMGWSIALPEPDNDNATPEYLLLENASIATSGDESQYLEVDGVRYSHIVDPKTGLGLVGGWTATVVASEGSTSDALATAVCVLGPEKGFALVDRVPDAACRMVRGKEIRVSKRWKDVKATQTP